MTVHSDTAVGVDVGGTRVRAVRTDSQGTILERVAEPVSAARSRFRAQLLRLIAQVCDEACVGVGIGIPGRVDAARGEIKSAGFLDIAGLDLPGLVQAETGLRAHIENDATMALVAEARSRPDGSSGVMLMMTVGTGIGGAILADGKPWYGGGQSGQFGHLVVAADGPRCNCGRRGCVETFSSGTALGRLIAEAGLARETLVEDLLERAEEGEAAAMALLDRWARPFQRALETLVAAVDPRVIVVGGGLGGQMVRALSHLSVDGDWFALPVEPARLGDDAGAIGAALRCFQERDG